MRGYEGTYPVCLSVPHLTRMGHHLLQPETLSPFTLVCSLAPTWAPKCSRHILSRKTERKMECGGGARRTKRARFGRIVRPLTMSRCPLWLLQRGYGRR